MKHMKVDLSKKNIANENLNKAIEDAIKAQDCKVDDVTELDISHNPITDISCLANFKNLRVLNMRATKIADIGVLVRLKAGLTDLDLADVPLSAEKFAVVRNLTNLTRLNLEGTEINDLSLLAPLNKKLIELNLTEVRNVRDFSCLKLLVNLKRLYLTASSIENVADVANNACLELLSLASTHIKTVSPLTKLGKLKELYLQDTLLEPQDLLPLKDLPNLTMLEVSDNADMLAAKQAILEAIQKKAQQKKTEEKTAEAKLYFGNCSPVVSKKTDTDSSKASLNLDEAYKLAANSNYKELREMLNKAIKCADAKEAAIKIKNLINTAEGIWGQTLLHLIMQNIAVNQTMPDKATEAVEMVKYLLAQGANPAIENKRGLTAIKAAIKFLPIFDNVKEKSVDNQKVENAVANVFALLQEKGAAIIQADLDALVKKGYPHVADVLTKKLTSVKPVVTPNMPSQSLSLI
jgi:hypothetical protein